MTFAEKLDKLTATHNRAKLSRACGLPQNAIADYINKGHVPSVGRALTIAQALGVSLDWIADDEQEWPPVRIESEAHAA